jgi:hypothetical protein
MIMYSFMLERTAIGRKRLLSQEVGKKDDALPVKGYKILM